MQKLIAGFFRAPSALISELPLAWQKRLGQLLGILWFDVFRIRRQVALANLKIAFPEWSEAQRIKVARQSLMHMGRTLVEYCTFPFYADKKVDHYFVYRGLENLEAALAKGRGALMLALHLGNGDFAMAGTAAKGFKINLISKRFKSSWLNDLWFGVRSKHGSKFISHEKSSFEILRALKRGEMVVFVLDQFMGPPIGVRTQFFGKETGTAAGLALMALRTKAPVVPVYTFRRSDNKTEVVFEPEMQIDQSLDQSTMSANISVLTQSYTDKLEAIVRQHPEQWMWIHRRWKEFRE